MELLLSGDSVKIYEFTSSASRLRLPLRPTTTLALIFMLPRLQCSLRCSRSAPIRCFNTTAVVAQPFPAVKLDYERYLQDLGSTKEHLRHRNAAASDQDVDRLSNLWKERKRLVKQLDALRRDQKQVGGSDRHKAIELREKAKETSSNLTKLESELHECANLLPNWSHPDVPVGDYDACRVVYTSGPSAAQTELKPEDQDHLTVATRLGWLDFQSGQKITGTRWPVLLREGAMLEWALTQYALHTAIQAGFEPISAPDVVRTALSDRCGFQPRDGQASQSFYVSTQESNTNRPDLVLAGTAEISLAGHFSQQTFPAAELPMQFVALGRAFRAEAGARGKEHRGLYRVHQFSKAELFVVCQPEESEAWLKRLVDFQTSILENLNLPIRSERFRQGQLVTFGSPLIVVTGPFTCHHKSLVRVRIRSMTSKHGCQEGNHGARYACSFSIIEDVTHHKAQPILHARSHSSRPRLIVQIINPAASAYKPPQLKPRTNECLLTRLMQPPLPFLDSSWR